MAVGNWNASNDLFFKVLLRDVNPDMVAAWQDSEAFGEDKFTDLVEVRLSSQDHYSLVHTKNSHQISCGDIFEGAPATDAIVSSSLCHVSHSQLSSV